MQLHSQAQWESLPLELQDHILWRLGMYNRDARLVSKAFAAKLRRWLWLSCPTKHPGFSGHFVEGLLRFSAEAITLAYDEKVALPRIVPSDAYSQLYTRVYTACTYRPPNNKQHELYSTLFDKVRDLAMDGTLSDMTGKKREVFIRFLDHVFKYLDRFYVKRLSLPDVKDHLVAAFQAAFKQ